MTFIITATNQNKQYVKADCSASGLTAWIDLSVPDNEDFGTSGYITTECYLPSAPAGDGMAGGILFANIGSVGTPNWYISCRRSFNTEKKAEVSGLTYTAGNRAQIAMCDDGVAGNVMDAYFNGSLVVSSGTSTGTALGSVNYVIGGVVGSFFGGDQSRKGTYYRVAYYSRKLTTTEIGNLNSGTDPTSIANLIFYDDFVSGITIPTYQSYTTA